VIRRISIFGASCSGKSTFSMHLCSRLKRAGYNAEFVPEYIKEFAIRGVQIASWDQLSIFSSQVNAEYSRLVNNKNLIVTECPILLSAFYAEFYQCPGAAEMIELAKQFDQTFPSYNLLMVPNFYGYNKENRYHTQAQARQIHFALVDFLNKHLSQNNYTPIKLDKLHNNCTAIEEVLKTYGYKTGCR